MIGTHDTYYDRSEVSNSDLSQLLDKEQLYSLEAAYRFGNLIDALITEPERCDHLNRRVDGEQFTKEEWDLAYAMLKAWRKDELCMMFSRLGVGQKVFTHDAFNIEYMGVEFSLPVRCKFDLWVGNLNFGADVKSTVATTQSAFENSIVHFDYERQAAYYMDLSKSDKFLFAGISKKPPHKIFKVAVKRGDALYNSGKQKYSELAFKYWSLYMNFFEEPVLVQG